MENDKTQDVTVHAPALELKLELHKPKIEINYFNKNWPILMIIIFLTIGSPFLGLVVPDPVTNIRISLLINIINFSLSFYAGTRYVEHSLAV